MSVPDGDVVERRCARVGGVVVICADVAQRLVHADRLDAAGWDGRPLREAARHFADVHLQVLEGHRTDWGLGA